MIKFIVGLGNPGEKYQATRHNVGRMIVNRLADHLATPWRTWKGHQVASDGSAALFVADEYMNVSGRAVGSYVNFFKINPTETMVVHDELDLAYGKLQLKFSGSAGGHHGVESVIDSLGTPDFWRLRVGIGRPPLQDDESIKEQDISTYVLGQFTPTQETTLGAILDEGVVLLVDSLKSQPVSQTKIVVTTKS